MKILRLGMIAFSIGGLLGAWWHFRNGQEWSFVALAAGFFTMTILWLFFFPKLTKKTK